MSSAINTENCTKEEYYEIKEREFQETKENPPTPYITRFIDLNISTTLTAPNLTAIEFSPLRSSK